MATNLKTILPSALWVLIAVFLCLLPQPALSGDRVPAPVIKLPTDAEGCIRPTEFMRRNHMHLLTHKRDKTVHEGIRTKDASLSACIDCHAGKNADGSFIPVNEPGQFCSTCHAFTAVKLDCFECHRTTPDPGSQTTQSLAPGHDIIAAHDRENRNLQNYLNEVQ